MRGVNRAIILGRVGNVPEVKVTDGGTMTKFSVATNESWTKDGEKKERTTWHNVTCFSKLAEICGEYVKKGSVVYVEGKIEHREYDKDGEKRYFTSIVADSVQFLGDSKKEESDYAPAPTKAAAPAAPAKRPYNHAPGAVNDSELGF